MPKLTKANLHRDAFKRLETKTVSCRLPPKDVLGKNADEDKLFMKQRPAPKTSDVLGNFEKMRFDKGKAHISKLKTTS